MKSIWELDLAGSLFSGLENVLHNLNEIERAAGVAETNLNNAFNGDRVKEFGEGIFRLRQGIGAIDDLSNAMWGIVEPIVVFDKKAKELQSITSVTEPVLKEIKGFAKESALAFGGDSANYLETYKVLLSKLGPELADKPEILKAMGNNVAILSKSMGGDSAGAVNVLTTAMNQYGVSIKEPEKALAAMTEMMNKMQAGAIAGSSELPELQAGIATSGAMAQAANLKFSELNSALQVLDKGSKKGAEGGIALRNALGRMGEGRFMPKKTQEGLIKAGVNIDTLSNKSLTFAERLKELAKIKGDDALVGQFFGVENVAAGQFMLSNIGLLEEFTQKIDENKNAAVDSANVVMQSHDEKIGRISAFFNNIKLVIGESLGGAVPYIKAMTDVTGGLLQTMPGIVAVIDLYKILATSQRLQILLTDMQTVATVAMTVAQELLNMAFIASPWGWVAIGIGLVIAAVVICWDKFEGFRKFMYQLWATIKEVFSSIGALIIHSLTAPIKLVVGLFTLDLDMMEDALIGHVKIVAKAVERGVNQGATDFAIAELRKSVNIGVNVGEKPTEKAGEPTSAIPSLPLVPNPNPTKSGADKSKAKGEGAAQSGRSVIVHINKLVEKFEVHTTTLSEGLGSAKNKVAETLLGAVADFEIGIAQT